MPRLILVRHGASSAEKTPRYFGHSDLPLTVEGERQAERLRARLAGERLDFAFASDLARCLATAETIVRGRGLVVWPRGELREIHFGRFEGLSYAEIERQFSGAAEYWKPGNADRPFPGGESVAMLAERVASFAAEAEALPAEATALVVAHGGPLKLLICRALGLPAERWWQLRLDLASLSVLDLYPEGSVLSRLNDTSHLFDNPNPG